MPRPEDRFIPDSGRRRRRARPGPLWRLFRFLLLLLAFAAIGYALLPLALPKALRYGLERFTGQPVAVEEAALDPVSGTFTVSGLRVGPESAPLLRLATGSLQLDWDRLLAGEPALSRLALGTGQVRLERREAEWLVGGEPLSRWRALPWPVVTNLTATAIDIHLPGAGSGQALYLENGYLEHLDPAAFTLPRYSLNLRLGEGRLQSEGRADPLNRRPGLKGGVRLVGMPLAAVPGLEAAGAGGAPPRGALALEGSLDARFDRSAGEWELALDGALDLDGAEAETAAWSAAGSGRWEGTLRLRLDGEGAWWALARGQVRLAPLRLRDARTGVGLETGSLAWEGELDAVSADTDWSVRGDGRLEHPVLSWDGGRVEAAALGFWGLSGTAGAGLRIGRMRLPEAVATAPGQATPARLGNVELEGLFLPGDAPPALARVRLADADLTFGTGAGGWRLQGLGAALPPPARVEVVEVGGGSRLRLDVGGLETDLADLGLLLTGLDPGGGTARLELRGRVDDAGMLYLGGTLAPFADHGEWALTLRLDSVGTAHLDPLLVPGLGYRGGSGGRLGGAVSLAPAEGGVAIRGEAWLEGPGPERASGAGAPFMEAAGRDLPAALDLVRNRGGRAALPLDLVLGPGGTGLAEGVAGGLRAALESAFGTLQPTDGPPLARLRLAPLAFEAEAEAPAGDGFLRLAELAGRLGEYPRAGLLLCGEARVAATPVAMAALPPAGAEDAPPAGDAPEPALEALPVATDPAALAARRAGVVRDALVARGLNAGRIALCGETGGQPGAADRVELELR